MSKSYALTVDEIVKNTPNQSGVISEIILASNAMPLNISRKKLRADIVLKPNGSVTQVYHVIITNDNIEDYNLSTDSLPEAINYYNSI